MFIPLKDLNPHRRFPIVNVLLICANVAVFLHEISLPPHLFKAFLMANAVIPARFPAFLAGRIDFVGAFLPLVASLFLHSGIAHIAGNMLFLWIFGDNVEDFFGHIPYLFFYLVCGIGSGLLHVLFNFNSSLPALGASGAISGVMGAYLILYPGSRILTLVFIFLVPIPAFFILVYWFFLQFIAGVTSIGDVTHGGVAWWAHVGGFLMGMALTWISKSRTKVPLYPSRGY
ncbi:MAG TPA: rhomboid family intramembrane serine protease [Verrucomicrobiae bacterium]|nr:rhomboid family intramembrane serine protease [Verrucomicrobiae bacterium]